MFLLLSLAMLTQSQQLTPSVSSPRLVEAAPQLAAIPDVTLVGYAVSGDSPRAIRNAINQARPTEAGGGRFDGHTRWDYSTRWRNNASGECDPASAIVSVRFTVTLPDLEGRSRLDRTERDGWDRYFTALVAHETNHVRIGMAGAQAMQAAMRAAPDCDTMRAAQQQTAAAVLDASQTYDTQTGHGRTEGAVYPR